MNLIIDKNNIKIETGKKKRMIKNELPVVQDWVCGGSCFPNC